MKQKDQKTEDINLLNLIPQNNIEWERGEGGCTILLKPKFKHPLLRKHLLPRLKNPHFKINLDEIGSFIMERCDGELTVREIGDLLQEEFGDKVTPLYDRLALFMQQLERNRFITYKNLQNEQDRD